MASSPFTQSNPAAPTCVETTGTPAAQASRILRRVPPPESSGTIAARAACRYGSGSGTSAAAAHPALSIAAASAPSRPLPTKRTVTRSPTRRMQGSTSERNQYAPSALGRQAKQATNTARAVRLWSTRRQERVRRRRRRRWARRESDRRAARPAPRARDDRHRRPRSRDEPQRAPGAPPPPRGVVPPAPATPRYHRGCEATAPTARTRRCGRCRRPDPQRQPGKIPQDRQLFHLDGAVAAGGEESSNAALIRHRPESGRAEGTASADFGGEVHGAGSAAFHAYRVKLAIGGQRRRGLQRLGSPGTRKPTASTSAKWTALAQPRGAHLAAVVLARGQPLPQLQDAHAEVFRGFVFIRMGCARSALESASRAPTP